MASSLHSPNEAQEEPADAWVSIARIRTTHGRRGEVSAELLTDFPERFQPGLSVSLTEGGERRAGRLEAAWFHKGRVILKLEGVDTLTDAERLRDFSVQVPRSERVALPADRLYVSDLMGCTVTEAEGQLGTVVGWQETGAAPLIKVENAGGEILIPFTAEICRSVDVERKLILVRLPEGLRDLNAAPARSASLRPRRSSLGRGAPPQAAKKRRTDEN